MAHDSLTTVLCAAVRAAPVLPAGLTQHALDPTSYVGARVAAAACRRDDLDLDVRARLTARAALDPTCPDVAETLARLVHEQVRAGTSPLNALGDAWASPAGTRFAPEVLGALRTYDTREAVSAELLGTDDLDVLAHAALAGWDPLPLAAHLAHLWDGTDDEQRRKALVKGGADLLPFVEHTLRNDFAAWWDTIGSDELVLHWAARCGGGQQTCRGIRQAAAARVIPAWVSGGLTGMPNLHAVRALTQATVRWWTDELLDSVNALAGDGVSGATRAKVVKAAAAEIRRRTKARAVRDNLPHLVAGPLDHLYDQEKVGEWLLGQMPDDPHAWAVLTQVARSHRDTGSPVSLLDLVGTANGVLA